MLLSYWFSCLNIFRAIFILYFVLSKFHLGPVRTDLYDSLFILATQNIFKLFIKNFPFMIYVYKLSNNFRSDYWSNIYNIWPIQSYLVVKCSNQTDQIKLVERKSKRLIAGHSQIALQWEHQLILTKKKMITSEY